MINYNYYLSARCVWLRIWIELSQKLYRRCENEMKEIYLAGGCFWECRHILNSCKVSWQQRSAMRTDMENPTYEMVLQRYYRVCRSPAYSIWCIRDYIASCYPYTMMSLIRPAIIVRKWYRGTISNRYLLCGWSRSAGYRGFLQELANVMRNRLL